VNEIAPLRAKPLWQRINRLFLILVAAPTLVSTIYFGLIASDVYVSVSKFVIYNPQTPNNQPTLGGLLQGVALGSTSNYAAHAVHDYLLSRNALEDLQKKLNYRRMSSQKSIDPFNRFDGWIWFDTSFEQLYRYYTNRVTDEIDPTSNITTLNVDAFTARDAQQINLELLTLAQKLVDQINERANQRTVRFYQTQVRLAESRLQKAAVALAQYRNQAKIFNPSPQANIQSQLISNLREQEIAAQLKLGEMEANAPKNPAIPLIKKNIANLQRQIESQSYAIAGNSQSLSVKSIDFERLRLAQTFQEKELAAAITSLEQAQIQARKQHLFIETIVKPTAPDEALLPTRWRNIAATFIVGLLLWGVFSVIFAGIREHHDR
jgi:capsular polysaccharide transport system permease protein